MKIGFIGLGMMGRPMCHNLLKAGHELMVCSRTPSIALVELDAIALLS